MFYCCLTPPRAPGLSLSGLLHQLAEALPPAVPAPAQTTAPADRTSADLEARRLLDSYGNSILRYAYSYLHNMSDAEEILQDTILKRLEAPLSFTSPGHEKAWLLRVAGNMSKNRLKYNAVRSTDELRDDLAAGQRPDLSFVWDAVQQLPPQYRAAIHLFYYEGLSTREIAQVLRKKEPTVRSDLRRGRERLRSILKEEYDFDAQV